MPEYPHSRESVVRMPEQASLAERLSGCESDLEASRCCAYNQTRERFVCVDVEAADFSAASLSSRLPALTPSCGTALWILPFRGISATSVRVPIDLIYLNQSLVVLATVESFPIFQAPASIAPAASVLVLPAHTIGSTQTHAGDQLILCAPDELNLHLLKTSGTRAGPQAEPSLPSVPEPAFREEQTARKGPGDVLPWVDHAPDGTSNIDTDASPMAAPFPAKPEAAQTPQKKATGSKNWLARLLSAEPPDPRKAPRESLSWLGAYFFTGGTPMAHGIRDISSTGMFIFTEERWYLGTVIRITLTDLRHPTAERSLTVNAKVVRWGNDGVGLQFVLKNQKNSRHGKGSASSSVEDVARIHVEQFLELVRSGNS